MKHEIKSSELRDPERGQELLNQTIALGRGERKYNTLVREADALKEKKRTV